MWVHTSRTLEMKSDDNCWIQLAQLNAADQGEGSYDEDQLF